MIKYVAPWLLDIMINSLQKRIAVMSKNGSNCADDRRRLNELTELKKNQESKND